MTNHKHLQTYSDPNDIRVLLDTVLADGAIVQRWIPKAGMTTGPFDLRVLVIHGRIAHCIGRIGRGTITNLHLDATRMDVQHILARFGATAWTRIQDLCLRAAACFPSHRSLGIDVMLDPRGNPFVLECNAWGDYLPGLLHHGLDSYAHYLSGLFGGDGDLQDAGS